MELSVSSFPVYCQWWLLFPSLAGTLRFLSVTISFVTRIPPSLFLGGLSILVLVAYSTSVLKNIKITIFLLLKTVGLQEAIMMWTALFSHCFFCFADKAHKLFHWLQDIRAMCVRSLWCQLNITSTKELTERVALSMPWIHWFIFLTGKNG